MTLGLCGSFLDPAASAVTTNMDSLLKPLLHADRFIDCMVRFDFFRFKVISKSQIKPVMPV